MLDIRTQIRTDLNPSKRIRFQIRSENIRTVFRAPVCLRLRREVVRAVVVGEGLSGPTVGEGGSEGWLGWLGVSGLGERRRLFHFALGVISQTTS